MVDRDKIESLIRRLDRYTGYLRDIARLGQDKFLGDPMASGSARYYLQVSIESCIDIANHIIASKRLRTPQDYRDTFRILNEAGIIPGGFAPTMQAMAGMRNMLVHLYWEVDDRIVYETIQTELADFETFVSHVVAFVDRNS